MRAGKLTTRIELQRPTVTTDSHGDQITTWTTLRTVSAQKLDLSGRERTAGPMTLADVTTEFRIRRQPRITLTPKDRVKLGARLFDIRAVLEWDGGAEEWRIQCTEHLDGG